VACRLAKGQGEIGRAEMKDDLPIPRMAEPPPDEYDRSYFVTFHLQLYQFLRELLSQGPVAVGEFRVDVNIPTSATGLEPGRVFVDNNNNLKLVLAVALFDVTGVSATASVGTVTILTP